MYRPILALKCRLQVEQVIVEENNPRAIHSNIQQMKKECGGNNFTYNDKIEDSTSATHLGIIRKSNGKPDIEEKINLDVYSLKGRVFMGEGLKPSQNVYIRFIFVVPWLLYGPEALSHTKKDIERVLKGFRDSVSLQFT